MITTEILIMGLICLLIVLVEHWFPWERIFNRELARPLAYIIGVLGFAIPLSTLLIRWNDWAELIALWVAIILAGAGCLTGYAIDGWLTMRSRMTAAENEAVAMRLKLFLRGPKWDADAQTLEKKHTEKQ